MASTIRANQILRACLRRGKVVPTPYTFIGISSSTLYSSSSSSFSTSSSSSSRKKYWKQLYKEGNDVFTLPDANENLVKYLNHLLPTFRAPKSNNHNDTTITPSTRRNSSSDDDEKDELVPRVLIPGCGKDISMLWLAQQDIGVYGVDYVGEPLRQFANEIGGIRPLEYERGGGGTSTSHEQFSVYQALNYPRLILVHADLLTLNLPNDFGAPVDGVWDRGSLTSVAEDDRVAYLTQIYTALKPGGRFLLEFLSCNVEMEGAVTAEAVTRLLKIMGFPEPKTLSHINVRSAYPAFSPPGLAYLDEVVMLATKPL